MLKTGSALEYSFLDVFEYLASFFVRIIIPKKDAEVRFPHLQ